MLFRGNTSISHESNIGNSPKYVRTVTFILHADHDPASNFGVDGSGLSHSGLVEAEAIGLKLPANPEGMKAYSANNLRSLGTVALAITPGLEALKVSERITDLVIKDRLKIDPNLDYMQVESSALEQRLTEAYAAGRSLDFLVYESDKYENEANIQFSTFSRMALVLSRLLLKNITADQNHYEGLLICSREFIYPCFRAALTREIQGSAAMDLFVRYYQEAIELSDLGRTLVQYIHLDQKNDKLIVKDYFDDLAFTYDQLEELVEKLELVQERTSS